MLSKEEIKKIVSKYWTSSPSDHKADWKTLKCKKCGISYYDWQSETLKEIEEKGFADFASMCPILSIDEVSKFSNEEE